MKHLINIVLFIVFFSSCNHEDITGYNKLVTQKLSDRWYVERYSKSYGATGGSIKKYFLTDSLNNKFMIGQCDEKEWFEFEIQLNKLLIKKYSKRNNHTPKLLKIKTLDLSD